MGQTMKKLFIFSIYYWTTYCGVCFDMSMIAGLVGKVAIKELSRCVHIFSENLGSPEFQLLRKLNVEYIYTKMTQDETHQCVNPLYVLLDSNNVYKVSEFFQNRHLVWLLLDSSALTINQLFRSIHVPFSSNVIVAKFKNHSVSMSSIYRVDKQFPLQIDEYNVSDSIPNVARFRQANLQGVVIKTAVTELGPRARYVSESHAEGGLAELWQILEEVMQFKSNFRRYEDITGSVANGSWTGMIGDLVNGDCDAILSDVNISPERLDVIYPLQTILNTRYQVYYRSPGLAFGFYALVRPLHIYVWVAIALWICLGGMSVYLVTEIQKRYHLDAEKKWQEQGFVGSALFVLQALSLQGSSQVPVGNSLRIVFFLPYVVAAVLVPCYSASLISSLTQRSETTLLHSMEDILQSDFTLIVAQYSASYNFFTVSNNDVYKRVLAEKIKISEEGEGSELLGTVMNGLCDGSRTAYFGMDTSVLVSQSSISCRLLKMNSTLPLISQSFALKKGNPFVQAVNHRIIQLREFGFIKRADLRSTWVYDEPKKLYDEISLSDVSTIFIMYCIGSCLAFFILIFEILTFRRTKRRKT